MDSLKMPPYSDCTVLTSHDLRNNAGSSSRFQQGGKKHIMETNDDYEDLNNTLTGIIIEGLVSE